MWVRAGGSTIGAWSVECRKVVGAQVLGAGKCQGAEGLLPIIPATGY